MSELDESDVPFEEFEFAQTGASAHLETMAQAARDASQSVLNTSEPMTGETRVFAARLDQVAEQCDAIGVLISHLDLPPSEDRV